MTNTTTPETSNVPGDWGKGYGRLAGKTALVTGSTRGLGRTMAEWLAREGANIIVTGREKADVDRSVAAIEALGARAWGIPADLARVENAHALAIQAIEAVDTLDILVNNAGMSISQPFWEVTDADYEHQANVNVRAPFIVCQHVARNWIGRGVRGRIVNVSTIGVFAAHHDKMVYNMTKAGVQTMTRNMAFELGPHGITVNCVAPGAVPERPGNEEFTPNMYPLSEQAIPLGRFGRAEDIATAVVYFCLPETEWTTGQTLLIDGAHTASMRG